MRSRGRRMGSLGLVASLADTLRESLACLSSSRGRAVMNAVAVLIGVGTLVVADGVASTSEAAIQRAFDGLQPDRLTVVFADSEAAVDAPPSRLERVEHLEGVRAAGLTVDPATDATLTTPGVNASVEIVGMDLGALTALNASILGGFQAWHEESAAQVALLGHRAADRLGAPAGPGGTIRVGARTFAVVGVIKEIDGRREVLDGIVLPASTASQIWSGAQSVKMSVLVEGRAADRVTQQIPLVVSPTDPSDVEVLAAPRPDAFEGEVDAQLGQLLFGTGLAVLVLASFAIAASATAATVERRAEIGMRRALGAGRLDIAVQFALETTIIGVTAAVVGAALGELTLVLLAHIHGWLLATDPLTVVKAPGLGLLVGLVAGAWPARRASLVSPVRALTN